MVAGLLVEAKANKQSFMPATPTPPLARPFGTPDGSRPGSSTDVEFPNSRRPPPGSQPVSPAWTPSRAEWDARSQHQHDVHELARYSEVLVRRAMRRKYTHDMEFTDEEFPIDPVTGCHTIPTKKLHDALYRSVDLKEYESQIDVTTVRDEHVHGEIVIRGEPFMFSAPLDACSVKAYTNTTASLLFRALDGGDNAKRRKLGIARHDTQETIDSSPGAATKVCVFKNSAIKNVQGSFRATFESLEPRGSLLLLEIWVCRYYSLK